MQALAPSPLTVEPFPCLQLWVRADFPASLLSWLSFLSLLLQWWSWVEPCSPFPVCLLSCPIPLQTQP